MDRVAERLREIPAVADSEAGELFDGVAHADPVVLALSLNTYRRERLETVAVQSAREMKALIEVARAELGEPRVTT